MPFALPTLESMTPSVDDVFKMVRSYNPDKDGPWPDFLLNSTVYLVKVNLKHALQNAIKSELASYVAMYGSIDESDDVEDYWAGFDEELLILFASVIEAIGQDAYDEIVPGHDMSDSVTLWSICDELAEHISNSWPTITDTLTSVAGLDKIKITLKDDGNTLVWVDERDVPGVITYTPAAPVQREVVGIPKSPGAPPNLSAIKGQPNSQLLAEAFALLREKTSDTELAEIAQISRTTLINYYNGRTVVKLRVNQAERLRQHFDLRIERLQRAVNIFAQVTRDS